MHGVTMHNCEYKEQADYIENFQTVTPYTLVNRYKHYGQPADSFLSGEQYTTAVLSYKSSLGNVGSCLQSYTSHIPGIFTLNTLKALHLLWHNSPPGAQAASFLRFIEHTQLDTHSL